MGKPWTECSEGGLSARLSLMVFFEFFLRKADVEPEESSTVPGVCCVRLGQNRCAGVTGLTITESSPFEFGRLSWCDKLPCQQALWLTCRRALPAPLKASGSVVVSWSLGFRSVCGPVCLSESLPLFVPSSISCRFCNSSLSLSPSLPLSLFSFPDFAFVCVCVCFCLLPLSLSLSLCLSIYPSFVPSLFTCCYCLSCSRCSRPGGCNSPGEMYLQLGEC